MIPGQSITDFSSPERVTIVVGLSFVFSLSLILNALVVFLSFTISDLQGKDFRFFLLNLSVIHILTSILCFFVSVVFPNYPIVCWWGALVALATGFCMMHGIVPLIFNRYINVCKPHLYDRFFGSRFKIFLVCLEPYIFSAASLSAIQPFCGFGPDKFGIVCLVEDSCSVFLVINMGSQIFVYSVLLFCSYRIWRKIKEMKNAQMTLQLTEKLVETKFLLRAVLIQALSPIPLQVPGIVTGNFAPTPTTRWIWTFGLILFLSTGIADGLATLVMVKPYRLAVKKFFRRGHVSPKAKAWREREKRQRKSRWYRCADSSGGFYKARL